MSRSKLAFNFKNAFPTCAEWANAFRFKTLKTLPRATLSSSETALECAKALNIQNPENRIALELYPGLGCWTRALKDIGFKRVISLEPQNVYYQWLQEEVFGPSEEKVSIFKMDGYEWETYGELKRPEHLGNLVNTDWSQVHPNLFFTGMLPRGRRGEQLLSQFVCCVHNKMAMHSLGRIPMAFWVPDLLYPKLTSVAGERARCKMSIVAEAVGEVKTIYETKPGDAYPDSTSYYLVSIVPWEKSRINADWDVFEYVLRHLFVQPKTKLTTAIK
ncbi:Mitochondrial transcription factor 1 [Rhizopus azygosporus]|uniref:rRNA adenine N(6)-methyltransferase n=1 Tax=Rhizopus azygosporus TaxID=86630 RepID=A0A367KGF6_RHIAZ|nr:Mitochondrial transcription factor 1 [Rhizopus azygosporus]